MKLPIDVKPNTDPTIFVWTQVVDTPNGPTKVQYSGVLPTSCEDAIRELIELAKRQAREIETLKRANHELNSRVGSLQSNLNQATAEPTSNDIRLQKQATKGKR